MERLQNTENHWDKQISTKNPTGKVIVSLISGLFLMLALGTPKVRNEIKATRYKLANVLESRNAAELKLFDLIGSSISSSDFQKNQLTDLQKNDTCDDEGTETGSLEEIKTNKAESRYRLKNLVLRKIVSEKDVGLNKKR